MYSYLQFHNSTIVCAIMIKKNYLLECSIEQSFVLKYNKILSLANYLLIITY